MEIPFVEATPRVMNALRNAIGISYKETDDYITNRDYSYEQTIINNFDFPFKLKLSAKTTKDQHDEETEEWFLQTSGIVKVHQESRQTCKVKFTGNNKISLSALSSAGQYNVNLIVYRIPESPDENCFYRPLIIFNKTTNLLDCPGFFSTILGKIKVYQFDNKKACYISEQKIVGDIQYSTTAPRNFAVTVIPNDQVWINGSLQPEQLYENYIYKVNEGNINYLNSSYFIDKTEIEFVEDSFVVAKFDYENLSGIVKVQHLKPDPIDTSGHYFNFILAWVYGNFYSGKCVHQQHDGDITITTIYKPDMKSNGILYATNSGVVQLLPFANGVLSCYGGTLSWVETTTCSG